jgi:hypothetical protein
MTTTENRIPNPLYAAAGAGDLAYRQLRKLPSKVAELRGRVGTTDTDIDRLRGAARRNANALVSGAQAAQERAQALYAELVARGEQVVRGSRKAAVKATAEIQSAGGAGGAGQRDAADEKADTAGAARRPRAAPA